MKFIIALALIGLAATRVSAYKYDQQVVLQILNNARLIGSYADCLLGIGSCTREGTEAKKKLPELIQTSCAKCTEQDKHNAAQLALALKKHFPQKFDALVKIYDPEGKRQDEFDHFLKTYGS